MSSHTYIICKFLVILILFIRYNMLGCFFFPEGMNVLSRLLEFYRIRVQGVPEDMELQRDSPMIIDLDKVQKKYSR